MAEEYEINIPVNVKYKSRLFELIFSRKEELLGLYNAANGTDYTDPELLDACRTLKDYSEYTARVRRYAQEQPLEEAVERAITECIKEGILAEFLSKYRAEAKKVSIYEYDAEAHIRMEKEDSYADGLEEGRSLGLEKGIKVLVENCQELECSYEYIVEKLCQKYQLDEDGAKEYMEKYWKKDLE